MKACAMSAVRVVSGTWIGVLLLLTLGMLFETSVARWQDYFLDELFVHLSVVSWVVLLLCPAVALIQWAARREQLPPAEPEPQPVRRPAGYALRYWRGELPMAHSLWVTTVLGGLAFYGGWRFLVNHAEDLGLAMHHSPILHALSFDLVPWWLFTVLTTWQLTGLTRAATRAVKRDARFFSWDFARMVRLLVVLALPGAGYVLYQHALPDVYEAAFVILDEVTDNKYTLTVRNGGTELEIHGDMTFGLTEDVERMLVEYPGIKVIHLNSPGGRVVEGEGLFNLIRTHRLATYSSIGCHSACGMAFLGGTRRYLNKHASVGVHRGWTHSQYDLGIETGAAPTLFNQFQEFSRRQKLYFLEAGADRAFTEQLFANLTVESMKYPSSQELLAAGVVHGVIERLDLVLP